MTIGGCLCIVPSGKLTFCTTLTNMPNILQMSANPHKCIQNRLFLIKQSSPEASPGFSTAQSFAVEKSFIGDCTNENLVLRLAFHRDLDPSTYLGYQDTEEKGSLVVGLLVGLQDSNVF